MAQQKSTARILLYTATADFRHDSIPTAIRALQNQSESAGGKFNVQFDSTEDRTKFTEDNLAGYDAIMFVSTTGEILDESGKTAFRNYLDKGGNFIAVHSASDSLRNDSWYGEEVGAFFDDHPALQNATVDVIGPSHPSTDMLPKEWHVQDEMYNFKSDPRSVGAVVILSANESSYVDNTTHNFNQGSPHPTAWFQEHGAGVDSGSNVTAGRSFYTSLGHLNETWRDDLFMAHVMGGVMWALESNTTKAFNSSGLVGNNGSATNSSTNSTSTGAPNPSTTGGGGSIFGSFSSGILGLALLASMILLMM
ncbi:class I glutamine amidotransferase-like protein [Fomitiporia mediterranea MF3/22]|uniref:class I glutamine amidotransferase-like protein n=1 Tax=Fomitiporia mediterranea (strain MF3/22) TaxID=694068 RepID=UPI0004408D67|nr:class I glutamine amidotransferase-like protein [Fomitiporia mediterranea MF3/22]EJD06747.1 class I glutamine amidotransferase-like protein [Fomitiporia mediterranea MF3/22]